jgi:hypothetical protein
MGLASGFAAVLRSLANSLAPEPVLTERKVETETPRNSQIIDDAAIKKLLETCARAFVSAPRHVRSNVMTFTEGGTRRQVNKSTAYNMETDPDCDLVIDATAAASGKAVSERRAAIADLVLLQITDAPSWGLRPDEQARVRPTLKSILSVPVFNPNDVSGPLLGTLQVDSDLTVEEAGFNRPEAAELLQQYADRLSLLMIGVNVRVAVTRPQRSTPSQSRVQNATQLEPGVYIANSSTSIFEI